ncbi:Beauvericin cluster-specific repressor BEA4 [Fusarium oxysporum f. sp. cubense]|uniref:Beauvericin cluster-specific repressor BEA4 n=1 Tax=Fusarium oxysporum f. sp. cubense TaxID=61366 RepID=A0A559KLT0_FUSOC|nr:Beauvericin cluster-specific repressor BEA4 [Fusarium oxysporum f. sp. cubense]
MLLVYQMPPQQSSQGRVARSRGGCVTCRSKHAKCDEAKPTCKSCAARGQKCGGYRLDVRWSTKHEKRTRQPQSRPRQSRTEGSPSARSTEAQPDTHSQIPYRSESASVAGRNSISSAAAIVPNDFDPAASASVFHLNGIVSPLFPMSTDGDFFSNQLEQEHEEASHTFSGTDSENHDAYSLSNMTSSVSPLQWGDDFLGSAQSDNDLVSASETLSIPVSNMAFDFNMPLATVDPGRLTFEMTPNAITYTPSVLIEYWFRHVCSLWSNYDSDVNLNRTIAAALWSNCELVYLSLQAMSAAHLSAKVPMMRQTSITNMKAAAEIMRADLHTVKSHQLFNSVPTSLLFSLMGIGTSICWLNATQLGLPFLCEAKAILHAVNKNKHALSEEQRQLLSFFNKSWLYCEMLLSMVTSSCRSLQKMEEMGDVEEAVPASAPVTADPVEQVPHPWTGVSSDSYKLFMRAMKLCHKFRRKIRKPQDMFASANISAAMQLIEEAAVVEKKTCDLDVECRETIGETNDKKTPNQHLFNVAEAYRQSTLLQLYQTFPELIVRRHELDQSQAQDAQSLWDNWITPIALNLVSILKLLPTDSGSKMTQPLLCVSASTGLRRKHIEVKATTPRDVPFSQDASLEDCDMIHYLDFAGLHDELPEESEPEPDPDANAGIMAARQFLHERLETLKTVLPPKPVAVAQDLTKAIWQAYDTEQCAKYATHWIDVMDSRNLKSNWG